MKARLALILVALLTLAGCTSTDATPATPANVRGELPLPPNANDPGVVPSPAPSPPACDPRASLRPPARQPAPGQMPAGSTMATIAKRGRLVVGIDQNAYLFGFRDPVSGRLVGFETDIARQIAKAVFGDPEAVQFRAITTADRIPVLQKHEVDLVIRTMTTTCERRQLVQFSTEYLTSGQRLLVNRGSGIKGFQDLGGKKACATRGSTSVVAMTKLNPKPIPVTTDSTLDCLVMLQAGQVAAVSTIDVLLYGLAAQDPGTEIVGTRITDEPSGIGIPIDQPDLVRFVNGVLDRMRADGTWMALYGRWLARFAPVAAPPKAVYSD